MNDKNFIKELRQKREEYGVTQTRLAVACGISREYYNRIEKRETAIEWWIKRSHRKTDWAFQSARTTILIDWLLSYPLYYYGRISDYPWCITTEIWLYALWRLWKIRIWKQICTWRHQYHVFYARAFRCFVRTERQRFSANRKLSVGTGTLMVRFYVGLYDG